MQPDQDPSQQETPAPQEPEESPPQEPSQGQDPSSEEAESPKEGEGEEGEKPEGEAPEASGEEGQSAPPKEPEKHRRTGGFARKVERLERQNQILIEQLQRLGAQPPTPRAEDKPKTDAEKAAEQFKAMVRQEAKALISEEREQGAAQAKQSEFQRRTEEARAAHPDFDDVVYAASDIPVSPALGQALLTSPVSGEIMYQLAKNPAELARISALSPLDAAREVFKLEAKASGSGPQKQKSAARPPAPPSKVGGSSSSTRSLDDLSISDYKRAYRSGRR